MWQPLFQIKVADQLTKCQKRKQHSVFALHIFLCILYCTCPQQGYSHEKGLHPILYFLAASLHHVLEKKIRCDWLAINPGIGWAAKHISDASFNFNFIFLYSTKPQQQSPQGA